MQDYKSMTPCERVAYYRKKIAGLSPPRSTREQLLIATFKKLVEENIRTCRKQKSSPLSH